MKDIKVFNKIIGEEQPCFIIAEAGVNHNGSLELAKKLIDVAVDANADAIKFQTFKAEGVATSNVDMVDYQKKNMGKDISQLEMLKSLELDYKNFKILKNYCDKKNIIFLSTPHSFDAIDFLEDLIPAYKFGSGDLTNFPALRHAAKKNKPIILGTGMANINEVKEAVELIKSTGNDQVILLHCTTNYPCLFEEVNLLAMKTLKKELNCLVGYSDHTEGILLPIAAVVLGASVVEKHFTTDKKLPGPDHKISLEPEELEQMIKNIRIIEKTLGTSEKQPTSSEKKIMKLARKSIVAHQDIPKGTVITENMITIKRPGIGLEPRYWDYIIGKTTNQDIHKDELITLNKIYEE